MVNNEIKKKEEFTISENVINKVITNIKHKYSYLSTNEIKELIYEVSKLYNNFINENPNFKISIFQFLIFCINKKIEKNLSKQELILILKENEDIFTTKSFRKTEVNLNNQKKQTFNNITKKISSFITIDDYLFKKNMTILANNHTEFSFQEIAILIIDIMDEKIIKHYKEYNIIEYCEKFGVDFFKLLDTYIKLLHNNSLKSKNSILLDSIKNVIVNTENFEISRISNTDICKELKINKSTFNNKLLRLKNKFSSVSNDIILNGVCDYYYIKKYDNKLLKLILKEKERNRDNLILEIVLLRMEQVLTYEEAYEVAVKNFEKNASLLYSKYDDNDSNIKNTDISFKK